MSKANNILRKFATQVVEKARGQLRTTRRIRGRNVMRTATGTLGKSLDFKLRHTKKGTAIDFYARPPAEDYARFIHAGVNGTQENVGSPYSFRSKSVPTEPIYQWLKIKRIRLYRTYVNKSGQRVAKFVPLTEQNYRATAFVMGRSIARKGIVAVPYFTEAVEMVSKSFNWKELNEAVVMDNMTILQDGNNNRGNAANVEQA